MLDKELLIEAALSLWPSLATSADLYPDEWVSSVVSMRSDARVQRVVLAMARGSETLIYKYEAEPKRRDFFLQQIEAQQQAFTGLQSHPSAFVPEILAFDEGHQATVMSYAQGETLAKVFENTDVSSHPESLEQAGRWICAFHSTFVDESRIFQPKFTMRFLRERMQQVKAGSVKVARQNLFLKYATLFLDQESEYEGQSTTSARTHGDLHLRNILVQTSGATTGIDFGHSKPAPVGHDLARLLVDYATLFGAQKGVDQGALLSEQATHAFFKGYTLVDANDTSVRCQMRMRIFADWLSIPNIRHKRSFAQHRRFRGLLPLAERVFIK